MRVSSCDTSTHPKKPAVTPGRVTERYHVRAYLDRCPASPSRTFPHLQRFDLSRAAHGKAPFALQPLVLLDGRISPAVVSGTLATLDLKGVPVWTHVDRPLIWPLSGDPSPPFGSTPPALRSRKSFHASMNASVSRGPSFALGARTPARVIDKRCSSHEKKCEYLLPTPLCSHAVVECDRVLKDVNAETRNCDFASASSLDCEVEG